MTDSTRRTPPSRASRPRDVWDIETEHVNPLLGEMTDDERAELWALRNTLHNGEFLFPCSGLTPEGVIGGWRARGLAGGGTLRQRVGGVKAEWTRHTKGVIQEAERIVRA